MNVSHITKEEQLVILVRTSRKVVGLLSGDTAEVERLVSLDELDPVSLVRADSSTT